MPTTIIGNIAVAASSGAFTPITTNTTFGPCQIQFSAAANVVMRINGVTPEVTIFPNGGVNWFTLYNTDPSQVQFRSGAASTTTVYAFICH